MMLLKVAAWVLGIAALLILAIWIYFGVGMLFYDN